MSKSKSVAVTVLFAVMLALIDMGMLKLWMPGFGIITGALAIFGFWKTAQGFSTWLRLERGPELPKLTQVVIGEPVEEQEENEVDVDAILREVNNAAEHRAGVWRMEDV